MNYSEEFSKQWKSLTNILASKVIESCDKTGSVDYDDMCRILSNEKKRWTVPGQYNAIWLDKVREQNAEVADELLSEMSAFELKPVDIGSDGNPLLYPVGSAAAGAAVGLAATKLIGVPTAVNIIGTVGLGAVGLGVGKSLVRQKSQETADKIYNAYKEQLINEGVKLTDIVKKADTE